MRRAVLAVDLGGTKILACVVSRSGRVLSRSKVKTAGAKGPRKLLQRLAECSRAAAAEAGVEVRALAGVGVAVPGGVDVRTGVVVKAVNLGWTDFPVRRLLTRLLGRPVTLENDANAGLFGEAAYGSLRPWRRETLSGFFIGTGIGGAVMLEGRLHRGASGSAGELGHMVIREDGPRCACGRRGCLEAVAGRLALEKRLKDAGVEPPDGGRFTGGRLRKALKAGDKRVRRELETSAEALGVGVANMLAILNPKAFVLGGGVMEAVGDFLFPRIVRSTRRHAFGDAFRDCRLLRSSLGDDAVVLGAAALALGKDKL